MDKTTQDLVWSVLPKEFKKKIKEGYKQLKSLDKESEFWVLEDLFGQINLISDVEEEEMLIVSRKEVMRNFNEKVALKNHHQSSTHDRDMATGWCNALRFLFGSKCLPDEAQPKQKDCDNPLADKEGCRWRNDGKCAFDSACYFEPLNPQEPKSFKYKVGQKVILHFYGGEVSTITEAFNDGGVWNKYKVKMLPTRVWNENELDPYEEPKPAEMTEGRYQYLNSLSLEDYDNETSADEQRQFCEYQHKHHPDEVEWLQTHSDDNEPQPAEPKFDLGDKAILKGYVCTIIGRVFGPQGKLVGYKIKSPQIHGNMTVPESRLEPYAGPKEKPSNSTELKSQESDKHTCDSMLYSFRPLKLDE